MGSRVRIRLFHILHFVTNLLFPLLKNSKSGVDDRGHRLRIRHLKQDDAFNTTWPPVLSIDKCCQVISLSIERTDHHVLLKASCCLRSLLPTRRGGDQQANFYSEGLKQDQVYSVGP